MKSIKIIIAGLFLFPILLISCGKDNTTADNGTSSLMLINASPNAPAIDAYADTTKINNSAVAFPSSSAYLTTAAGNHAITIKQSGTGTILHTTATLSFIKNASYSLFFVDSVSKASALYLYDYLTAPTSGKTNFRILHLSPNTPKVDFILRSGADSIAITNKAFKDVPDLYAVFGRTYDIRVKLTGTQTVIASASGIVLTNGKIYTLYLKGLTGGVGPAALGIEQITNN